MTTEQPTIPARKSQFSANVPHWPTSWDSTMLGLFKECPKKFHYQMILGYQPKGRSIHLTFGLHYHSILEHYDHFRASGQDHETALRNMVRYALQSTGAWTVESPDGERVECEADTLHALFTPWESGDALKNRYTLIRSCVWHAEAFRDSQLETVILASGKPAVELSFNFEAFEIEGETISLCGHMDKLVRQKGTDAIYVADHKSTKGQLNDQFYRSFTPHNQFSLYTLAGKVVLEGTNCQGVLVSAASIAVGFTRFGQRPIPRPAAVIAEWLEDTKHYVRSAREMAISGHWPQNDKSCSNYGGCPFAKVCAVSPSHRAAWLKDEFVPFHWNPLEVRGDI